MKGVCMFIIFGLTLLFFQINCAKNVEAQGKEYKGDLTIESVQEELLEEQIQSQEIKLLKKYIEEYSSIQMRTIFGEQSPELMMREIIGGKTKFNLLSIIKKCFSLFVKEILLNISILINLIILTILCALVENLQASFLNKSVGELAFYVCYIVIVSLLIIGFKETSEIGVNVIERMVGFMYATIPIMITLLISGGNVISGGIFRPILVMTVETSATIIKNVFMPIVFLSVIFSIINNISDRVHLSKLAGFLKKIGIVAIGIILTIFVGIVTIQSSTSAIADGVANKTIKFAIGTFIPVVGGYLSEAADTVISCSLLIKNAAGILVLIGVIAICLIPILKIAAIAAIYKITCALIEPISGERVVNCINDIANSMLLIMGFVAAVTFMFIVSIAAIIASGNMASMIR